MTPPLTKGRLSVRYSFGDRVLVYGGVHACQDRIVQTVHRRLDIGERTRNRAACAEQRFKLRIKRIAKRRNLRTARRLYAGNCRLDFLDQRFQSACQRTDRVAVCRDVRADRFEGSIDTVYVDTTGDGKADTATPFREKK